MDLRSYLKSLDQKAREQFAMRVATTVGHLNNIAYGGRTASAALARQLEIETNASVRRWDLRPTDWHRIWPELIATEGAPAVPAESEAQA